MASKVGLSAEQIDGVVGLLKTALADEYVLYTKTRNYHWNVTGPHFNDLHKFFESQYEEIDEIIDEVAEVIRYYGVFSPGSLAEFLELARLKEAPGGKKEAKAMVADLLNDHETLSVNLRKAVDAAAEQFKAADVADLLTGWLEQHEKIAWMLRSYLE